MSAEHHTNVPQRKHAADAGRKIVINAHLQVRILAGEAEAIDFATGMLAGAASALAVEMGPVKAAEVMVGLAAMLPTIAADGLTTAVIERASGKRPA